MREVVNELADYRAVVPRVQGSVQEKEGWEVGSRERKQYYQPEFQYTRH